MILPYHIKFYDVILNKSKEETLMFLLKMYCQKKLKGYNR